MLLSSVLLTACNAQPAPVQAPQKPIVTEQAQTSASPETHPITSFETYDEVVQMRMLYSFGKAEITEERATDGAHALKVTANGEYESGIHPKIAIPTGTEYLDKTDFTDVDKLYLDVYNDTDEEQNVYVSYLLKKSAGTTPSSETPQTIGAKQSKTLVFDLDRDMMNCFVDLDTVQFVCICFDCSVEYNQPYRVFYIDNFRYSTTETPIEEITVRGEDEIESCDDPAYLMAWSNINNYIYAPSSISFNTDPKYIKQGTGSFRITNRPNYGVSAMQPTYNVGWKIDPDIKDLRDYYSYSFWVYNPWHEPLMLRASYHYSTGVNYPTYGAEEYTLKANDWTYIEMTTEFLLANGVNPKNFNALSISVWVPREVPFSFYFDAVYFNKTPSEHKEF